MTESSYNAAVLRLDCALVVGGTFHDMDFARLELLRHLSERPWVRTRVFEDYENIEAITSADLLISYTCDVRPSQTAQQAISDWVLEGGRWYALHGTNSILEFTDAGLVDCPNTAQTFMDILGSRFVAHPPIGDYKVAITAPEAPLVKGLEPFIVNDELYLMETREDLDVLLHVDFGGEAPGFVAHHWPLARHPVLYLRQPGKGSILYLTLGHCRGHYDMQPRKDWWPTVDRGAWDLPVFHLLLKRGIDYLTGKDKIG